MSDENVETRQWLSISEAAHRLNVHVTTLRRWADSGEIACTMTPGGHRRFSVADINNFTRQRRRMPRRDAIEQTWAETAVTVTRSRLAEHSGERWLGDNGGWREQHRELGRQLIGLAMQFISGNGEDDDQFIREARSIGRRYAQIALRAGLSLTEVLSASIFFRDMLIETALQLPENVRVRPEANLLLLRKINVLLNTVHLTIVEEYDAAYRDILPRD